MYTLLFFFIFNMMLCFIGMHRVNEPHHVDYHLQQDGSVVRSTSPMPPSTSSTLSSRRPVRKSINTDRTYINNNNNNNNNNLNNNTIPTSSPVLPLSPSSLPCHHPLVTSLSSLFISMFPIDPFIQTTRLFSI